MAPPPFIDIEASGFGSASYPVEVGLVLPNGDVFCSLILPEPDWTHWDVRAEEVHGIDRELLLHHGRPATEVALDINQHLQGLIVYCDSWYHDFTWLSRLYQTTNVAPNFRLEDLRSLLNQAEADHWRIAKEAVVSEMHLPRHRASNDARVLQATLARVQVMTAG